MASGKTLQSTIEISGVLSPSLQKAINSAVDRLSEMAEETLESADAATRLAAEMSAQEDILKNLKRAYAGYVASGEEGSEQAQELAKRIRTVDAELEGNRSTLQAAERATDSLADTQEEAADSAEESSEGYTVLKNVLANLISEGIEKAVDGLKELAIEGETALAMLEARTGATAKQTEGFEDVMNEVYNSGYGESLGEVSERLSTVIQMTDDLDNASLAKVTKNATALEDVFGFDTAESLRAVNSLMDQFGISSDEAFNLIVQGAQKGLNQNGDLLDTINEYSVQFKGAGYSADDMFNMLANGAETGTWSVDKLGDAVKEFNIRMSDGTANDYLADLGVDVDTVMAQFEKGGADAQAAIDTVMGAIMDCDDATLQYQAGVGLFGTMWEDLGADTVASLMSTEGAIKSTADAMEQMDGAAYDTLENSLKVLGRTIKAEVLQPIADKLTPVIKKGVDFVTGKVAPAVDWMLDHLPELGIALGAVSAVLVAMKWGKIVSGVSKAVGAFKTFGSSLMKIPAPVLIIIGIVAALAAAFAYLWKNNEEFRENMGGLWEELKGVFSELGNTLGNTLSQLAPMLSEVLTILAEAFAEIAEGVLPILMELLSAVLSAAGDLISQLVPFLVQLISDILPVLQELLNQLIPFIIQVCQDILPVLSDTLKQLLPVVMNIVEIVLPLLLQLIETLLPIVMQIIQNVLPILLNLIQQILPFVTQLISIVLPLLVEILNMVAPLLSSIVSLLGPILELVLSIVSPILNLIFSAITPLLNILINLIGSVLQPIIPIIKVVANVITSVLGGAISGIQPIIQALTSVFEGLINFVTGIFTGNWSKAWDGVVQIFGGLWDGLVGLVKAPINGVIGLINGAIGALNNISVDIPDWVPVVGGQKFGINIPKIPMLATGGFTNGVSIAGEDGMEAVISFDSAYHSENVGIWAKAGQLLGVLGSERQGAGLTSKAGELLALDDFSLGSLADGTSVVNYYDFSGFTWSPQIQTDSTEGSDDFMARLRAHEHEFFDWLEEFVKMREVSQYA